MSYVPTSMYIYIFPPDEDWSSGEDELGMMARWDAVVYRKKKHRSLYHVDVNGVADLWVRAAHVIYAMSEEHGWQLKMALVLFEYADEPETADASDVATIRQERNESGNLSNATAAAKPEPHQQMWFFTAFRKKRKKAQSIRYSDSQILLALFRLEIHVGVDGRKLWSSRAFSRIVNQTTCHGHIQTCSNSRNTSKNIQEGKKGATDPKANKPLFGKRT